MSLLNSNSNLRFAPGTRYSYTNLGYLLLGLLIQRVSGIAFEDYIVRYLLEPLSMKSSGFAVTDDFATGYSRIWSAMGVVGRVMLDRKYFGKTCNGYTGLKPFEVDGAPYGGLGGTAADLLQLGRAMIASGSVGKQSVIETSLARLAISPVHSKNGLPFPIGLGWHLGETHGEPFANHLGGGAGFRSELRIYPRINQAIAVVANETSFDTSALAQLPTQR